MIPGLALLRGYQRSWLRHDLIAGITVAAYLVPQVMAYATVAGLPPVTGLWSALPALVAAHASGSVTRGARKWRPVPGHLPAPIAVGADGSGASQAAVAFAFEQAELRDIRPLAVREPADTAGVFGAARQVGGRL